MSSVNNIAITLEAILDAGNLRKACKQVVRNKGSAGVDGNDINSLRP